MDALWKTWTNVLPRLFLLLLIPGFVCADDSKPEIGGHTKLCVVSQTYPSDSLIRDIAGSSSVDTQGELRLNVESRMGRWSFDASYQLAVLNGETFRLSDDGRRLFDLSSVIDAGDKSAMLHRLDRLWVGYTSEKAVVRFGRQALTWGNGLFYAPMDLVNPFDPAAIDTEYKAGDDMLYAQYLRADGSDLQSAYVFRRDLMSGNVDADEVTIAVKYHKRAGEWEYDALLSQSYGDSVAGIGARRNIGGAVWSGDIVFTDTESDIHVQVVTNLSYSWNWGGKNMSGALEYYFNGFGQSAGNYDLIALANNPDLLQRLNRAELFALGRHYVAGSVTIEMTPLWGLSPTILVNVRDPSALLQLVTNYSVSDNMTLLGSINIPIGASGTEFGGIQPVMQGRYFSSDVGVFAQIAWYF